MKTFAEFVAEAEKSLILSPEESKRRLDAENARKAQRKAADKNIKQGTHHIPNLGPNGAEVKVVRRSGDVVHVQDTKTGAMHKLNSHHSDKLIDGHYRKKDT